MSHALSHGSITLIVLTFWNLTLAATASSYHNHSQNALRNSTRPYSVLMTESIFKRGQGMGHNQANEPFISYEHGTFQHALWDLYTHTKNETYLSWIKKGVDTIVTREGHIIGGYDLNKYTLDDIRVGESMINLYQATKEEKYKVAAGVLHRQMKLQPRTAEGGFWHKKRYAHQQWLDGLYMALPFYTQYAATFEASTTETVFTDLGHQFDLVWKHCLDQKTGLLRHGYDNSKQAGWADPITGASPEVWIRALGWYIMSLVDLLTSPLLPRTHPTSLLLTAQLHALIPALLATADPQTGAWRLVLSQPGTREGNYIESSGSAMFIYALLKSVRLGLVADEDGKIVAAARKAYQYLLHEQVVVMKDGSLGLQGTVRVGSLDLGGDFEYYTSIKTVFNDLKGTAPFVMASLEVELLSHKSI